MLKITKEQGITVLLWFAIIFMLVALTIIKYRIR